MRNRIKELRLKRGWSQDYLAGLIGVTQQHLQRMEAGGQRLNTDHLLALGAAFGVDPQEVLFDATIDEELKAPLLDEIQAGNLAEAAADIEPQHLAGVGRWIRVNLRKPTKFALQVRGDSMDRVVPEGGVVVVDYSVRNLETGELGVFRSGGRATFKRLRRRGNEEWIEPDSDNPRHGPIFPDEGHDIQIIGRVVEMYREPEIVEAEAPEIGKRRKRAPSKKREIAPT